jgi:hypothetical protein
MMNIRRVLTVAVATVSLAGASVLAQQNNQQSSNPQQNRRDQEKRSQQEQRDIEALVQLADAVSAGKQPAPTDIPVMWTGNHFVKGAENATYIPFTLTVDPSKLAAPGVALYVRAVPKGAPAAAQPAPQGNNNNNRDRQAGPTYPWDDIQFLDVPAGGKISRALMLKPGEYEIFVGVKEKTPQQQQRNAPPQKSGLLRHTLTVPDYSSATEISISTPIIADSVEPLTTPLSADDQRANPYTFGGTLRVVPAADATLKVSDDLQLLFWVYGVQHNNGVPDVQIEYNFHQKTAEGEKFFNKTQPQTINQSTLPPGFSITAGHQVLGFLGVPLKSFPAGEYRAEIKITDKLSGKTLTHNATFTVQA